MSAAAAHERSSELITAVDLEHRATHHAEQLSGGEQQRVSIAVALANNPPLLLADEPTGELDAIAADAIYALLGDLNSRFKTTIIIVTHDPEIASRVDRVVAIRDGRTSMEIFRSTEKKGGVTNIVHDEYVLVDSAGAAILESGQCLRVDGYLAIPDHQVREGPHNHLRCVS